MLSLCTFYLFDDKKVENDDAFFKDIQIVVSCNMQNIAII